MSQPTPEADLDVLIARCADGDRAAFREIYQSQSARMHGLALRITRQPSLAADAVHDAFVNVWQNAGRFDAERGAAEAWLTGIVRFRALDLVRRGGREVTGVDLPEQTDQEPDALHALVGSSEHASLRICLEELDEDKRRLVVMAFIDGLTHADLAEKLKTPLGTIKSSIRRGLASLRKCLES